MLTVAHIYLNSVFHTSSAQIFQENDPPPNPVIPYGPSVTFRAEVPISTSMLLLHINS